MARHLMRKHSDEKEVALVICLPPKSRKRKEKLEQLRRKGNYFHNMKVLQSGKGEIVTYRQPSESGNVQDYLPCNICYAFFVKTELWRHEKLCRKTFLDTHSGSEEPKKKRRVQTAAVSLLPLRGQASQRCSDLICRMVVDKISTEVKNDPLICEYGDRLLEKHGNDRSKDGHVSQKMRELGRFMLAAKSLNSQVKTLQDVLVPPNFSLAVAASKKASGYTRTKYRYSTPSLALKLGHSLKTVCDIMIGQHVKAEDEMAASRVRSFSGLLAAEWDLYVSRRARTNLEEDKWNKKEMIPLTEDVMKLQKMLKATEEASKQKLMEGPNPQAYKTLSECILSQIILFNRRRQGEAAKMPLVTYKERNKEKPNRDVMQCLSKLEQDLSQTFTRIVIRGKRGRKVPVLLTKQMSESLDFLIENRNQDNEILDSNEYVFARQNSDSHLRGSDCLRKYAVFSGASRPETLTSTQLRKHVATLSQIMNLKDNELDQLAKFMGHDIRVHREYYRLTENTLQLAKMSKLLMAVELGTDVYKGKSLDEIDLGLEIDLSAKDAAPQLSQPSESDKDAFNADVFEDTDESDCQTQRPEPSEMTRTKKKGPSKVKRARMTEPTADSDVEESDCQTQRPEPSEMTRTKKKGPSKVKRARMTEPTADSDEEPLCLTQRPEPSETTRTKKKGPSKVKRARMTEPTADSDVEESDCQTQRPEPSEMTRTKKKGPSKVKRARMTEPTADSDVEESDCQTQRPEPSETTMMKKKGKTKHLTESEVRIRRPWTKTEKAAVQRQLGNFIVLKRVPGKEPCQKALEREPSLQTRTWRDIKNQVYNTITTLKKRQK
ncbi:uncharacterized protein LOC121628352 isoform X2 [Melanotaenia boesemani]|uniref:uncharacterized protein LOC121628352 isoform X2 n=1 Tax=Melanotaenia boesemani TaxID=1250792 RepID=UPI001C051919|nr:uncharacterized protein LOC121628352 isoform X2 [Melanotaenia boesemani]